MQSADCRFGTFVEYSLSHVFGVFVCKCEIPALLSLPRTASFGHPVTMRQPPRRIHLRKRHNSVRADSFRPNAPPLHSTRDFRRMSVRG